jgi:thiamine pyrophosphate-dependent acetolactate synthase large subunit-like protein
MFAGSMVGTILSRLGTGHVFGVLGGGNFLASQAMHEAGCVFVPARHESAAVCMAAGYARMTGGLGLCTVHYGPAIVNALTGIAEAAQRRSPVLIVTGCLGTPEDEADERLLALSGAEVRTVHSVLTLAGDTVEAAAFAVRERRPVVLRIPVGVQGAPSGELPADLSLPAASPGAASFDDVSFDPASIDDLCELLATARGVLIVAGAGALPAVPELETLADRLGALLATTIRSHGVFAHNPWSLGPAGAFGHPLFAGLAEASDVVLAFGASLNGWTTGHGKVLGADQRIVHIDVDVEALGRYQEVALGIVGDAKAVAGELLARGVSGPGVRTEALRERIAASSWQATAPSGETEGPYVDPRTLTVALDGLLPAERTLVVDAGHFLGFPMRYFTVSGERGLIFALHSEACGLGLPTAIGAQLADPGRLVVLAAGDGGLLMSASEFETLARLRAPVLVVVYDDAAHSGERHLFSAMGMAVDVTSFPPTDFVALASGYGIEGTTVRSTSDLGPVTDWLTRRDGPFVVDAKIDPAILCDWIWSMLPATT